MVKTLRVRTREGWVTKPTADLPENRLTAEEADDNFLALEDNIELVPIGLAVLVAAGATTPSYLPLDGSSYGKATYPDLWAVVQPYTFSSEEAVFSDAVDIGGAFGVSGCDYSMDGNYVATVAGGSTTRLVILDATTWTDTGFAPSLHATANGLNFSPDGTYLAVASGNTAPFARVLTTSDWNIATNIPVASTGNDVAFSNDSAFLAVAHAGGNGVSVFNSGSWSSVAGLPTLAGIGHSVAWSPDGAYLAIGHQDGDRYAVLDTNTWTAISTPAGAQTGTAVEFSPDGKYLAVGLSFVLLILETTTWTSVTLTDAFPSYLINNFEWSADSKALVIAHNSGNGFTAYNTADWTIITGAFTGMAHGSDAAFSPDQETLIVVSNTSPHLFILESRSPTFTLPTKADENGFKWKVKAKRNNP